MTSEPSLFSTEERTIACARALLEDSKRHMPRQAYADLLAQYERLHRQSARLVKMGDRMHALLNRLNEDLASSEEKYRKLFESSIQGVFRIRIGPDGPARFEDVNPAMASMFGHASPADMLVAHEDLAEEVFSPGQFDELTRRVLNGNLLKDHCLQLRRPDGGIIWVELCARGRVGESGALEELWGTMVDVTDRRRMLMELKDLARRDSLTGLWNRGYFMELGQREMRRVQRDGRPLSVVYFDADHFKRINDTHGHDVGDQVLKHIAKVGGSFLRALDIYGRLGGEEFAVILPETDLRGALCVAERMRHAYEHFPVTMPCGLEVRFTASFGVAGLCRCEKGLECLLKDADSALYRAKNSGRNKVCHCSGEGAHAFIG